MKTSKLLLIGIIIIVIALILFLNRREKDTEIRLSLDVQNAIEDFQSERGRQMGLRKEAAEKLMPYIKIGMSKVEVEKLLGVPDSKGASENLSVYTIFYSQVIQINYDENGKVIHVEGPGIEFLSHYDRNWAFIRLGMTKDDVISRLYAGQKELEDGKQWQYFNPHDPHLYNVFFNDNDKVIKLEKIEIKSD